MVLSALWNKKERKKEKCQVYLHTEYDPNHGGDHRESCCLTYIPTLYKSKSTFNRAFLDIWTGCLETILIRQCLNMSWCYTM